MLKLLIVLHCIFAWIDNIGVAPFVESHFAAFTGETLQYYFAKETSMSCKKTPLKILHVTRKICHEEHK